MPLHLGKLVRASRPPAIGAGVASIFTSLRNSRRSGREEVHVGFGYDISCDAAVALADGHSPTRVFRTDAGLSIDLLAARTGLSIDRISRIEDGDTPRIHELRVLGRALAVPVRLLFDE
jgi:hypothetical protein